MSPGPASASRSAVARGHDDPPEQRQQEEAAGTDLILRVRKKSSTGVVKMGVLANGRS